MGKGQCLLKSCWHESIIYTVSQLFYVMKETWFRSKANDVSTSCGQKGAPFTRRDQLIAATIAPSVAHVAHISPSIGRLTEASMRGWTQPCWNKMQNTPDRSETAGNAVALIVEARES